MTGTLPFLRTRLELDRTLRHRSFFARAVAGRLTPLEYVDLLVQLATLAEGLDPACNLVDVARSDAAGLGYPAVQLPGPDRCASAGLLRRAVSGASDELELSSADVGFAVLATSWTREAMAQLQRRFPDALGVLTELAARGASSLARVERDLSDPARDPRELYVFAELVRGALLGLAAHLEFTWPAPVASIRMAPHGDPA